MIIYGSVSFNCHTYDIKWTSRSWV